MAVTNATIATTLERVESRLDAIERMFDGPAEPAGTPIILTLERVSRGGFPVYQSDDDGVFATVVLRDESLKVKVPTTRRNGRVVPDAKSAEPHPAAPATLEAYLVS